MEEIKVDTVSFRETDQYKKLQKAIASDINNMTKSELLNWYYSIEDSLKDLSPLELKWAVKMMEKYKGYLRLRHNQTV